MNNFAPVFIPTLCRYEHFKRCVESLSACTHADKTDLVIALDYPLNESHWDGYRKIEAYIGEIKGLGAVNIIKRNENYGAVKNYIETKKELFEKYDRLIFSEDDNEFSPNFLDYMNKGLDKFENDPRVYAVCGYNYPIEMPPEYPHNFYVWKGFSAWGYGIWKDRHMKLNNNLNYDYVTHFLSNISNVFHLMKYADHYLKAMLQVNKTKQMAADIILSSMLIKDDAYCVFPAVSKVRNHGHDGSGAHCGPRKGKNIYLAQAIDTELLFDYDPIAAKENNLINSVLRSHLRTSIKSKIKLLIKYLIFLLQAKEG